MVHRAASDGRKRWERGGREGARCGGGLWFREESFAAVAENDRREDRNKKYDEHHVHPIHPFNAFHLYKARLRCVVTTRTA